MALALDPVGLMRWVRKDADLTAQWVVIEMLEDIVLWSGGRVGRQAGYLLATKDPLGIVLAARMLVDPPLRWLTLRSLKAGISCSGRACRKRRLAGYAHRQLVSRMIGVGRPHSGSNS